MSTNPIDNYLNSFMNNEEKENLKKKKMNIIMIKIDIILN